MMPPLWFGADVLAHPGTMVLPAEFLEQLVYYYLKNLAYHGFEHVYLMGYHGGIRHNVAIEDAIRRIHKDFGVRYNYGLGSVGARLFVTEEIHKMLVEEGGLSQEQANRDAHGGAMEASIGLHLFPHAMNGLHKNLPDVSMVDFTPTGEAGEAFIRSTHGTPFEMVGRILGVLNGFMGWQRITNEELGYVGSPSMATKELGKKLTKLITDTMYDELKMEVARPKTDEPLDQSAYNMGRAIGPGTIGSRLVGTYRGPRRLTPVRDTHPLQLPEAVKTKSVAQTKKRPAEKTVRVKVKAGSGEKTRRKK